MRNRRIIILAIGVMVFCLSGCGKKKISVTDELMVSFNGYNGYGTAKLENEYAWESEALEAAGIESVEGWDTFAEALKIESAVSYEMSPTENLSNGDEVTVKAIINQNAIENFDFELVADSERKFTVENLEDTIEIDPFEDVEVLFEGVSSDGRAIINTSGQQEFPMNFKYIVEPDQRLKNEDTVVIKISNAEPEREAIQNGYTLSRLEREITVTGLMHYAENINELPDDVIEQLKKQTEDIIEADTAADNARYARWSPDIVYNLENKTFLGNYFLYPKSLEAAYRKNICYFVYKLDYKGKEDFSVYYAIGYYDLLILEDGTCSYDFDNKIKPYAQISKGFAIYDGYENIDRLYNDCVTQNLADYTYESTVEE